MLGLHGQFYVDVWEPARRYRATLGYRLADGTLVPLASSEVAELPPLGPADDRTWREMALPPPAAPAPLALKPVAPPAPPPPAVPPAVSSPPDDAKPVPLPDDALPSRIAALSPGVGGVATPQPAQTTARPAAALAAPTGEADDDRMPDNGGPGAWPTMTAEATAEPPPASPAPSPSPSAAAPLMPPRPVVQPFPLPPLEHSDHPAGGEIGGVTTGERPFWEMPATVWAGSPDAEGPSPLPGPSATGEHEAGTGDVQEAAPGAAPGADEGPTALPLPLENVLSLSSFVLGRDPVELEVNAELHVFGRVKPGSRLQLFGRDVRVRPDGTFSVHRPLASGAAIMPVLMTEQGEPETTEERAPGREHGHGEDPGEPG